MEALELAKNALREHLLRNKDKIKVDLEQMRNKSKGNDIYCYVENFNESFSFENFTAVNEVTFDAGFEEFDSYSFVNYEPPEFIYTPPLEEELEKKLKKGTEISSVPFFFDIIAL